MGSIWCRNIQEPIRFWGEVVQSESFLLYSIKTARSSVNHCGVQLILYNYIKSIKFKRLAEKDLRDMSTEFAEWQRQRDLWLLIMN